MSKIFNFKLLFIAIFFFLTIAIKNCENFQLRDVSSPSETKNVGTSKTTIRFPFRKLEKINDQEEEEEEETIDDDDDDENSTDTDSSDEKIESDVYKNYKFTKVRRPTIEIKKKREDLRFSKLAQFCDDSSEDESDIDEDENKSIFSKIFDYFKSNPKEIDATETPSAENDDDENDSTELEDQMEDEEENVTKPMLVEMYDKFKSFLEARNHDRGPMSESEEDNDEDVVESHGNSSGEQSEKDQSTLKNTIKGVFRVVFNRIPFNSIFDFDDTADTDIKNYDDSEEDDINYQKLLREEREQEKFKTESLINHIIEEESQIIDDKKLSQVDIGKKCPSGKTET